MIMAINKVKISRFVFCHTFFMPIKGMHKINNNNRYTIINENPIINFRIKLLSYVSGDAKLKQDRITLHIKVKHQSMQRTVNK